MKLFIDSAVVEEIKIAHSWGMVDGVTTNPTLIMRAGGDFKQTVISICKIVNGPVSAEVMSSDAEAMVHEGRMLADWHKHVYVKVPCTVEGLKACRALAKDGIKVNVTLVFSTNQVLLAAKAGAALISPFVGRLNDAGEDGMQLIAEAMQIVNYYKFGAQILVASVRNPGMVTEAALLGAHIATVPFKVLEQMYQHPLTDKGIEIFKADWEKAKR